MSAWTPLKIPDRPPGPPGLIHLLPEQPSHLPKLHHPPHEFIYVGTGRPGSILVRFSALHPKIPIAYLNVAALGNNWQYRTNGHAVGGTHPHVHYALPQDAPVEAFEFFLREDKP